MKLLSLVPMLATTDLKRTIEFYTNLGFKVKNTFGDPPVWVCLDRDGVEIMFNAPPRAEVTKDLPLRAKDYQVFYFKPNDVAALHVEYKSRGVPVTPLRVTVYHMKEFEVRDPEGYWLWFGQETKEPPTVTQEDLKGSS